DCDTRIRTNHPIRYDYSVDWANYYHDYYFKTIQKFDFVAGGVIWNFVDFNSEGRDDAIPHVNLKGMLTQDRKPKDLYYYYQSKLRKTPVVKILPTLSENRSGVQDSLNPSVCTQRIWVYANVENPLLTANGKAIVQAETNDGKTYFDVPFQAGENTLVATVSKDGKIYTDLQKVNFSLLPRLLNNADFAFRPIYINCGVHYSYTDNMGQVWMPDQEYRNGSWGYIGGKMHIRSNKITPGEGKDILGTTDDPLFQTQHVGECAYQIDVPNGDYEVTLYFAEILSKRDREKLLNLLTSDKDETLTTRIFNVSINENKVIENLNIAKSYGESRPVVIKFPTSVNNDNGIKIDLQAIKGDPVINAIEVRLVY
ncbi:MAG: malectin domain-containing carbohydrate-binding protein, partial [Paludibacter sp.]